MHPSWHYWKWPTSSTSWHWWTQIPPITSLRTYARYHCLFTIPADWPVASQKIDFTLRHTSHPCHNLSGELGLFIFGSPWDGDTSNMRDVWIRYPQYAGKLQGSHACVNKQQYWDALDTISKKTWHTSLIWRTMDVWYLFPHNLKTRAP